MTSPTQMRFSASHESLSPRVRYLRSLAAIRDTASTALVKARSGASQNFTIHDEKIEVAARFVAELTRKNYPDLEIPMHSRWRHFEITTPSTIRNLAYELIGEPRRAVGAGARLDCLTRAWDLTIVSVLLDAGAGNLWRYRDEITGQEFTRSEGLGIASLRMFQQGLFSTDPAKDPLRVDALRLTSLTAKELAEGFQVSTDNPLAGLEGRVALLKKFGEKNLEPDFALAPLSRPGELVHLALNSANNGSVSIPEIFTEIVNRYSSIWPDRLTIDNIPMGDVWHLEGFGLSSLAPDYVPFHKLTQWLLYSLAEPLIASEVAVDGLNELTGLPEYRNGGLLIDTGVLELKNPDASKESHMASSPLIVEWRALTIALLDEIADYVRQILEQPDLELAQILQGGTWTAGRVLAADKRGNLAPPPLTIVSDGTVF